MMTLTKTLLYINSLLSKKERLILGGIFVFSLFISITETAGITLMMPFISIATNINMVQSNPYFFYWYQLFSFSNPAHFIALLGGALILFYLVKNALSILFVYSVHSFAQNCYYKFSNRSFRIFLGSEYQDIIKYHSTTINKMILTDSTHLATALASLLQLFSHLIMFVFIYGALLWINVKLTLLLTVFFGVIGLLMITQFSRRVGRAGKALGKYVQELQKVGHEVFSNFKVVKVCGNEKFIMNEFHGASRKVASAHTMNMTLQNMPRPLFEVIGLSLIIMVLVYVIYRDAAAMHFIPLLSAYALAFYRFLTSLNGILALYSQMLFSINAVDVINVPLFDKELPTSDRQFPFNDSIVLKNVSFQYKQDVPVLSDINLTIHKGQRIGFMGESGIGKSTLVDIMAGIYKPLSGKILIDGQLLKTGMARAWRRNIGYVPQKIYLFDGSVAQNIVFGRAYDKEHLIAVLKKAHIYDFLNMHQGLDTQVGEDGIKLSGGQRQRIALARALYTDPDILVLDEATSSLDTKTEGKIMDDVYQENVGKTLLVVAHRLSTIVRCDRIFEIKNGVVRPVQLSQDAARIQFHEPKQEGPDV